MYHGGDDPPHEPLLFVPCSEPAKAHANIKRILDVGCGDGNFTASLAKAGFTMYGIDLSPRRI
jgi:2-polyprenyl-3-methyl-5-hydroxy-6-metoxy-1,4-benzoquinol methylase